MWWWIECGRGSCSFLAYALAGWASLLWRPVGLFTRVKNQGVNGL
jgi:hypothetical protein